ncbi:MAG: dTDP-4-dehydrorhamnose reductase [Myxococcales bacterium]|nr:dTDP-4-dehydrorhamnose reductase [Myxococcales bacterium]
MRIVVTGARGMLGRTLATRLHEQGHTLHLAHTQSFNITDPHATHQAIQEAAPDVVIHPAAYTAVDKCETEVEKAFGVNAQGAGHIAIAAQRAGARLIAISTDYVFAGDAPNPYVETDRTEPRTIYGQSKLAGEAAIRTHCPDHIILRVAWLYGAGGPSFVHTMLKLGAIDGPLLKVVNDQHGNPTSCEAVANHIIQLLDIPTVGTFHLTSEGETTWYDFTKTIFALKKLRRGVEPCGTEQYPRPAPRPKNSRLDNRGLRMIGMPPMPHWQESLEIFLRKS